MAHSKGLQNRDFWPVPFWGMTQASWHQYVASLEESQRGILELYPFKWAYVHPTDSHTAIQFLQDIQVDDPPVDVDAVQAEYDGLSTFAELESQGKVEWGEPEPNEMPSAGFRMIPEWEPMAGVLLNWPTFYPPLWETFRQMVKALDHVTTYLRIPEGYLGAAVLAWLDARGIDLASICPIPGPIGDVWARDYAPLYGLNTYTGEGVAHKFVFAAYGEEYRKEYRYAVDADDRFVWKEGFAVHRSSIMMDGGSILTDGCGTHVITRRLLVDNPDRPNLFDELEQWLSAERMIVLDEQPGDTLGHINHFKFISPEQILLGVPDQPESALARYLDHLRSVFERHGYEIVDMPIPTGLAQAMVGGAATAHGLYANSLLINGRVLSATFGAEEHDRAAMAVYREALPDYEVIPIDAYVLASNGGAVNCSSANVPDVEAACGE